eukprot:m.216453 g.216453  ORF g.216453 m.216453 type:complete len:318 (-) comp18654_c2_seq12:3169-4122(-)
MATSTTAAAVRASWSESDEQVLQEPFEYLASVPGKEVRSTLIEAFNLWLQIPNDKLDVVKRVTKMLHNASLMIDDIEDNSKLRRGIPAVHTVYGMAQTINSANYVYFNCMEMVVKELTEPAAVQAFTEQLLELHRGQGLDIFWRDTVQCPTEEQYCRMVQQKTGGLFLLAIRLMQVYSDSAEDFSELANTLGLYFQIRDDYANLQSAEYAANKSFCEDITEGKFSFPIIHSIRTTPHDHQVISILRQHTEDVSLKQHLCRCLMATDSFAYTKQVMQDLSTKALAEVQRLGGNVILEKLIAKLGEVHDETLQEEQPTQ